MNKEELIFKWTLRACASGLLTLILWGLWRSAAGEGPQAAQDVVHIVVVIGVLCGIALFVTMDFFLRALIRVLDKKIRVLDKKDDKP